jgi:membrane protease YdiL (CAAX protease family)
MWIVISPLVMDSFGWIELSDGLSLLLFVLSSLSGPALAAFWVTGILEGRAGMARLVRRTFQVRAGLQWYAVALFIFLIIWLVAYSFLYAGAPIRNLIANPSLLLSAFLPSVIMGLIIPSIGEEPGWRGFALPRLQAAYGPILATLILGTLHGVWHLPALFTPLLSPFTINGFIVFVLTAAAGTFIYTWVFNNTRGSVWMAMVLHASSNAASQLVSSLIPEDVALTGWMKVLESGWINAIVFTAMAILLVILTRGTLGYSIEKQTQA